MKSVKKRVRKKRAERWNQGKPEKAAWLTLRLGVIGVVNA